LPNPLNTGSDVNGQSKKLMPRDRISGPIVNTKNPIIHGVMKKYGVAFLINFFCFIAFLPLS
jgi:hypothetical protein